MFLNLKKTLKNIDKLITEAKGVDAEKLELAYREILRLRAQVRGAINDLEDFGGCRKEQPEVSSVTCSNITNKRVVTIKTTNRYLRLKN